MSVPVHSLTSTIFPGEFTYSSTLVIYFQFQHNELSDDLIKFEELYFLKFFEESMKIGVAFTIAIIFAITLFVGMRLIRQQNFPDSVIKRSYVNFDGNRVAYFQKGTGRDVLLVHGTPGSIEDWSIFLGIADSNKFRMTGYDRLGHGASSPSKEISTVYYQLAVPF